MAPRCEACSVLGSASISNAASSLFFVESELLPERIHASFCGGIHYDLVGPGAGETLCWPLAGGVYAHLRTVILHALRVIERVYRTQDKLHVALRIDGAQ